MLVLTRRLKESITIADNIIVTILQIRGNQVRIGVTAPENIEVHREEVYQKIQSKAYQKLKKPKTVKNISNHKIHYLTIYRKPKNKTK